MSDSIKLIPIQPATLRAAAAKARDPRFRAWLLALARGERKPRKPKGPKS